jgi:hypothetical protein
MADFLIRCDEQAKPGASAAVSSAPFLKPDHPWNQVATTVCRLSISRRSFCGVAFIQDDLYAARDGSEGGSALLAAKSNTART